MGNIFKGKRKSDTEEGNSSKFKNKSNKNQSANFNNQPGKVLGNQSNKGPRSDDGISSKQDQNNNKTTRNLEEDKDPHSMSPESNGPQKVGKQSAIKPETKTTCIQKQEHEEQQHLANISRMENDSLKRTAPSKIEESIINNKKTPKIAEAQVILPTKSEHKSIATEGKPTRNLKIINMQEHFDNDLDFDSIQYSPDSMEYIEIIKSEAEKFVGAVESFSNTDSSTEYFLLDEKLLRLIERLDKIYCQADPERLKLKLETIEFINKLHEILDKNVIQ